MCFECASRAGEGLDDYTASKAGDDDDSTSSMSLIKKEATAALAATDCFICEGFSAKTCAAALTTVISGLASEARLPLEKELLVKGDRAALCDGVDDKACLSAVDGVFAALSTADKVTMVGSMCGLVESSTESLAESSKESSAALDKQPSQPTKKVARSNSAVSSSGVASSTTSSTASSTPVSGSSKKTKKVASTARAFHAANADASCSLCTGFSSKTCALALTNVISGLARAPRLSLVRPLLDASGTACPSSMTDDACLALLDAQFADLGTAPKVAMVSDMCGLLEASASSSSSGPGSLPSSGDDEATSASAHTANTRSALLLGTSRTSSGKTKAKQATSVSVQFDALAATLTARPTCLACVGFSDRGCLARLDASFHALSSPQRLALEARMLSGYPTFTTCAAGDASCLTSLDNGIER
jgi:hypothetical protein